MKKSQKTAPHGIFAELYKNRILTLMIAPAFLFVILFSYIPMIGIILAFKDYNYALGIIGSEWVGLKNFEFFFLSGTAFRVTLNTFLYNIVFTITAVFFQVGSAIFLSEMAGKMFKKTIQSIILVPHFVSWVVVGAIVYSMFNYETGVVNSSLATLGIEPIDIMNNVSNWPFLIVFFQAWKSVGYGTVVYMSAISGIGQDIYEAADIDGANCFQKAIKLTLPSLKPTIITLILLSLGNIIRGDFGMFYNLTGNNPLLYEATDIVDTFVFRSLMQNNNIGMSTAAGVYQSIIGFVIIISVNAIIKKIQPDYALF